MVPMDIHLEPRGRRVLVVIRAEGYTLHQIAEVSELPEIVSGVASLLKTWNSIASERASLERASQ